MIGIIILRGYTGKDNQNDIVIVGMATSYFKIFFVILCIGIAITCFIWYAMTPCLYYFENMFTKKPYVIANERDMLLNGTLHEWNNWNGLRINGKYVVEKKIINENLVYIKYKSADSSLNDTYLRILIPKNKEEEAIKLLARIIVKKGQRK